MAKFMVFAAVMIAMLAFAQATRFTITTTVDEDDENQRGQSPKRCQQQVQQQQQRIRSCQKYLASTQRLYGMDMMIEEVGQEDQQGSQKKLRECCQVLENFDNECRCEAVKQAFRQQQQQQQQWPGQQGQQGVEQIRQVARNLPQQCNLSPRQCQV